MSSGKSRTALAKIPPLASDLCLGRKCWGAGLKPGTSPAVAPAAASLTTGTAILGQVVFPPDWRNYFMIFKGSDEEQNPFVPKYYEMQAANNNNYNLICEKWGFSKDLSGWNIAKLVMRKLPAYVTNPTPPSSLIALIERRLLAL